MLDANHVPKWNPAANLIQLIKSKTVDPANTIELTFQKPCCTVQNLLMQCHTFPLHSVSWFNPWHSIDAVYYIHIETTVAQAGSQKRKMVSILQQAPAATGAVSWLSIIHECLQSLQLLHLVTLVVQLMVFQLFQFHLVQVLMVL